MQDVSDAVGLLKGSLYYYIRSKEDLLFEILKGLHKDGEEIIASVQFGSADPMAQLRMYLKKAAMFSGLNAERLMIFLRDFENIPEERRKEIISEREMYSQTVRRLIEEAQVKGLVTADLDVSLAAKLVSSAITSTHEWLSPKGRRPLDEAAADIADILTRGLELPNARRRAKPSAAKAKVAPKLKPARQATTVAKQSATSDAGGARKPARGRKTKSRGTAAKGG